MIDYKTGRAPDVKRALQAPIYALCAQERLGVRDGQAWTIDEAGYMAFAGKRGFVPVVKSGADGRQALDEARERLDRVTAGIAHGVFPPQPHDMMMCRSCPYPSVCRKDYVDDE